MERSPLHTRLELSPDLLDHLIARARAERSEAIAGLFRQALTALCRVVGRVAAAGRRVRACEGNRPATAR